MDVPINYVAVVVASLVPMVMGMVWYGKLFSNEWMKLSGISDKQVNDAKKKGMAKEYAIAFVGSLLMSYVLAHALVFASSYTKTSGVSAGLMVGLWNWLGFIVPLTLGSVLWEGKPWKLWLINNGYQLINLLIMGVILAVM